MARIDDLIDQVHDEGLRTKLTAAAADLRKRKRFGLVYEDHVPESVLLTSPAGIRPGVQVMVRSEPSNVTRYTVRSVDGDKVELDSSNDVRTVTVDDVLLIKGFAEPVYPVLRNAAPAILAGDDKPFHVVINGENFHALQLLLFAYENQFDLIYLDPPYNTGDRVWTYNNDYVDDNDTFQHSKWLSFMEKRLRLAKRLLKPDGMLVVTIDEHEVHHLGVLLASKDLFGDARRQMITIVNNGAGVSQGGFYRVEEYAFVCFLGDARPQEVADDLLSDEGKTAKTPVWFSLIRFGGVNALPAKRPGLVYPIIIDPDRERIVGVGPTLKDLLDAGEVSGDLNAWRPPADQTIDGKPVVWPFRGDGSVATWQTNPAGLMKLVADGFVRVRPQAKATGGNLYSVSYIKSGNQAKVLSGDIPHFGREPDNGPYILGDAERAVIPKTVWRRARHDAGKWGSRTLRELLGSVAFDYAKSPYAVLDILRTLLTDRPDALVLDFFAGSGTTLHALAMLNVEDDGRRRSVLVTNNQVDEATARLLHADGHHIGDPEFEAKGICRAITIPRVAAALTGRRDGTELTGTYQDGRPLADGFPENAAFFDLTYADPDLLEVGELFDDVLPALWLAAGGQGNPTVLSTGGSWLLDDTVPFAVLFDEDRIADFVTAVENATHLTHVWLVTDSDNAYSRMRAQLPGTVNVGMLYRDYLRNFRLHTETIR